MKKYLLQSLFIFPILVLLIIFHEIGHYIAGLILGIELLDTVIFISKGQILYQMIYTSYPLFLIAAGIIVEFALILCSFCIKKIRLYLLPIQLFKLWNTFLFDMFVFKSHDWSQILVLSPFIFSLFLIILISFTLIYLLILWRTLHENRSV